MVSQPDRDKHSPPASSLTVRGAQSVVSARTSGSRPYLSSRSKRYNRSHAGGTSYVPQNEFPLFNHSGDVEIIIKAGHKEHRYLLHRHTLTRCSGFFEASTSQQWSKATVMPALPEPPTRDLARIGEESRGTSSSEGSTVGSTNNDVARTIDADSQATGPKRRWRYELDPGTGRDDIPMLIQKDAEPASVATPSNASTATGSLFGGGSGRSSTMPVARNKPTGTGHQHSHSNGSFFRSVANLSLTTTRAEPELPLSQADTDLLRDYDNLFRIFYNYAPVLDGFNIVDAYVQCKSLLTLADQYDALAVTGPRVDHHLLQFQTRLWKQIAKYPVSYLRLGYLARSKIIFQEALIHVVGQWPAGERSLRHALPDSVLDIIEDKVDELEETVSRIEGRLFRLTLTNSRGEKTSPGTSFLDWLAVSLFRQWLADNTSGTTPPPPPPTSDRHRPRDRTNAAVQAAATLPSLANVGRTYRTLGSPTGNGFLDHDECKRFLKLSPELYSRDNLRRFEKRIDELKAAAREIVRPLMGTALELEMDRDSSSVGPDGRSTALAPPPVNSMTSYLTCIRVNERDLPWEADG